MFVNKKDQPWVLERVRTEQEVYDQYPVVMRNGERHLWRNHFDQVRNPDDPDDPVAGPVSLGFKEGALRVQTRNWTFEGTMSEEGEYRFVNERR
jgi:hypothetical protein